MTLENVEIIKTNEIDSHKHSSHCIKNVTTSMFTVEEGVHQ